MQMISNLTAKKLISHDTENSSEDLMKNYADFMKGLISFPLNIPGTSYHKCLQVINFIAFKSIHDPFVRK